MDSSFLWLVRQRRCFSKSRTLFQIGRRNQGYSEGAAVLSDLGSMSSLAYALTIRPGLGQLLRPSRMLGMMSTGVCEFTLRKAYTLVVVVHLVALRLASFFRCHQYGMVWYDTKEDTPAIRPLGSVLQPVPLSFHYGTITYPPLRERGS